jgi:uncharacterized protein (TIGR02466 family)
MNRELYFATPIYIKDVGTQEFNTQLEQNIINWSKQNKGILRTNIKGWHSETNMHEKPEYKMLVDMLYEAQNFIYNDELLDNEPYLGNMWANINPPGGYNRPHTHPNSLWSGVYYVRTSNNSGNLKIEDHRPCSLILKPKRKQGDLQKHLWNEVNFEPIAGRLIMFPSWLNHSVEVNQSNDIRISVSFNFLQRGMFV